MFFPMPMPMPYGQPNYYKPRRTYSRSGSRSRSTYYFKRPGSYRQKGVKKVTRACQKLVNKKSLFYYTPSSTAPGQFMKMPKKNVVRIQVGNTPGQQDMKILFYPKKNLQKLKNLVRKYPNRALVPQTNDDALRAQAVAIIE